MMIFIVMAAGGVWLFQREQTQNMLKQIHISAKLPMAAKNPPADGATEGDDSPTFEENDASDTEADVSSTMGTSNPEGVQNISDTSNSAAESAAPTPSVGSPTSVKSTLQLNISFAEVKRSFIDEVGKNSSNGATTIENFGETLKTASAQISFFNTFQAPPATQTAESVYEVPILVQDPSGGTEELGMMIRTRVQYKDGKWMLRIRATSAFRPIKAGAKAPEPVRELDFSRELELNPNNALFVTGLLPHREFAPEERDLFAGTFFPEIMASPSFQNHNSELVIIFAYTP
jgi:hypothetical protein